MTFEKLKQTPTTTLFNLLLSLSPDTEQDLINIVAYELTTRIYVPHSDTSFDTILDSLGYIPKHETLKTK